MRRLLAHWAADNGLTKEKAYRLYHQGALLDRFGNAPHTEREGWSIYVYEPDDPLENISMTALVERLKNTRAFRSAVAEIVAEEIAGRRGAEA